ncbi:hypothetical protein H9P43_009566 [Blastocladiella emersonii ATCC 22665]|nr:hypothetical protein H9P43_009566 [Blastocladiella emersonii ATCC 22665]
MTRSTTSSLRSIILALCLVALAATTVHAAPARVGSWVVEIAPTEDFEAAAARIAGVYESHGMHDVAKRITKVQVGNGYRAIALPNGGDQMRQILEADDHVRRVEPEIEWQLFETQRDAVEGLDRIDARQGLDRSFTYPGSAGEGVDVIVIDSGIDVNHPELAGRAMMTDLTGEGNFDANGHGSHCAGTIGGRQVGIAKKATLIGLKVFDRTGRGSNVVILQALQLVSQNLGARRRPTVVNMSLGGPRAGFQGDTTVQRAIASLSQQGVNVVVAAGNESQDACNVSPAFVPEAITVAASDPRNDQLAYFSNVGRCVDIVAPGVNTLSIAANSGNRYTYMSGTSMAAPHVAGVLATYRGMGMSAQQAQQKILSEATPNVVRGYLRGTPNRHLFMSAR